jgi:type IV secretion system protein VirD4
MSETTLTEIGRGGSSRFMTEQEIRRAFKFDINGLFCGVDPSADLALASLGDGHALTVAGIGGGKSRSIVMPELVLWRSSALVVDPSGEIFRETRHLRRQNGRVIVFDPYGMTGEKSGLFNPLAELATDNEGLLYSRLEALAQHLCPRQEGSDSYWSTAAQNLALALLIHIMTGKDDRGELIYAPRKEPIENWLSAAEPSETETWRSDRRTLGTLREMILKLGIEEGDVPPLEIEAIAAWRRGSLAAEIAENHWNKSIVSKNLSVYRKLSDSHRLSILGTLSDNTRFLDDPGMRRITEASDFTIRELMRGGAKTVYLIFPPDKMATAAPWVRVFLQVTFSRFMEDALKDDSGRMLDADTANALPSCLFIIDEFANLGYFEQFAIAADTMRKHKLKLHPIIQEIGQLKRLYGERFLSFVNGAVFVQFFAPGFGVGSAEFFSTVLGKRRFEEKTRIMETVEVGSGRKIEAREAKEGTSQVRRGMAPLRTPDELARELAKDKGNMLLLGNGRLPAIVRRLDWSEFKQRIISR